MKTDLLASYGALAAAWIFFCGLHSFLIAAPVTRKLQSRLGSAFRFYRIVYNGIAVMTLVPPVWLHWQLSKEPFFRWEGPLCIVSVAMVLTALWLLVAGARRYDLSAFIGFAQLRKNNHGNGIGNGLRLDTEGILGRIRHPWYTAGILLIWSRPIDGAALISNIILSFYFWFGAILEERKLVAAFGDTYRLYQKRVPMLLPFRWRS